MLKREFGKSGISVSRICLGTMLFGTMVDRKTSETLLDCYLDHGGNFIDTSNNYPFWIDGCTGDESELLIGKWLKKKQREDIVIATKVGARPKSVGGGLESAEGLSEQVIRNALSNSLYRLGTDYIDIYYTHIPDPSVSLEETLGTLVQLQKEGKIHSFAASNLSRRSLQEADRVCKDHGWDIYQGLQNAFSYLQPKEGALLLNGYNKAIDSEHLAYSYAHPTRSLLAYSPLLRGIYAKSSKLLPPEYQNNQNIERLNRLDRLSQKTGYSKVQLVLSWILSRKALITPISSASSRAQLEESLAACSITLSPEEDAFLQI